MNITKTPLFLVALAFAAGIALSAASPSPGIWGPAIAGAAMCVFYFAERRRVAPRLHQAFVITLGLTILTAGWMIGESATFVPQEDPGNAIGQELTVQGTISEELRPTKSGFRTILDCESPIMGKVLLYLPASASALTINDQISASMQFNELPSKYPAYANYLHHQGIHASAQVRSFTQVGHATGFFAFFGDLRTALSRQMAACFPDRQTAGLSSAMLLGDRSGLDTELKRDFAATGLSHIVAISGMNFAIIYLVLCFLLTPLTYLRHGRQLRSLLVVSALVFFALLAGANPAIVRAAIMLSIIDLGKAFWQKSNSLNALATSALVFLLFDPQSLFAPDFQLSYAAVLGILALQNPILHYFHRRAGWLPKAVASSLAVTLAAQIATTPLVAWHFHTFPTYFLLANLIVLPLVTLVVQIGFAGFLLAWIPGISEAWGGIMDFLLWSITGLASLMAQLPGATITAIEAGQTGIWVLAGQILGGLLLLEWRFCHRAIQYLRRPTSPMLASASFRGLRNRAGMASLAIGWVLLGFLL